MKDLVRNNIRDKYLSNLSSKSQQEYEDVKYDEEDIPQEFKDIAEDLSTKASKYKFDTEDEQSHHPFISCKSEYAEAIGFDSIMICPYKGHMHSIFLFSNYMAMGFEQSNLTFDVYNCQYINKELIYRFIITELFNFKRDFEKLLDN